MGITECVSVCATSVVLGWTFYPPLQSGSLPLSLTHTQALIDTQMYMHPLVRTADRYCTKRWLQVGHITTHRRCLSSAIIPMTFENLQSAAALQMRTRSSAHAMALGCHVTADSSSCRDVFFFKNLDSSSRLLQTANKIQTKAQKSHSGAQFRCTAMMGYLWRWRHPETTC